MDIQTTTTGRAMESGHWYDRSGRPVYEIKGSNGFMRPVTLRDARKLGLVPGFSAIAAMESKPQLERWKINQALLAAITLTREPDESADAFLERARQDSYEQSRKAAATGTAIHAAIEGAYEGAPIASDFLPYVSAVTQAIDQHFGPSDKWLPEKSFAHELGYGGKSDLHRPGVVLDVKTKDFGPDKDAEELAYPEHCMQLVAYAQGFGMPNARIANVFVSTRQPGLVLIHEWRLSGECSTAWEAFRLLLRLWQLRKGYDSSFVREVAA